MPSFVLLDQNTTLILMHLTPSTTLLQGFPYDPGHGTKISCDTSTNSRRVCMQDLYLTTLHPHFKVQLAFQVSTIQGTSII